MNKPSNNRRPLADASQRPDKVNAEDSGMPQEDHTSVATPTVQLKVFLRNVSRSSALDIINLIQKDTLKWTRLLSLALRIMRPNDCNLDRAAIQKIVSCIYHMDREVSPDDLQTRRRLYEVVVDLMEWSIKHKVKVSSLLWKYNLVSLKTLANIYRHHKAVDRSRLMLEKALQYELKRKQPDQASVVAGIYSQLALLSMELQDFDGALQYYQRSLKFLQESVEVHHPLVIATLESMAEFYRSFSLLYDALSVYHHILILQDSRGLSLLETAKTLSSIGLLYYILHDYTNALHNYHEALTMLLRYYGGECGQLQKNHSDIAMTLNSIGMIQCEVGNYDQAHKTFQRCLSMHIALSTEPRDASESLYNDNAISAVLYNLGVVHTQKGENEAALELYRKSIEIKKKLFAGESSQVLACNLQKLSALHRKRGEYRVAILYLEEAIGLMKEEDSSGHPLHHSLILLGSLQLRNGDVGGMMAHLTEACYRTGNMNEIYHLFCESGSPVLEAYSMSRVHPPCAATA